MLLLGVSPKIIVFLKKRKIIKIKETRKKKENQTFPPKWGNILQRNVFIYNYLPEDLKEKLHKKILVFINEKRFIRTNGYAASDNVKVTVAGLACLLILNLKKEYYKGTHTIVIYSKKRVLFAPKSAGRSWGIGFVELSWPYVSEGKNSFNNGYNLTIHEFAHQLDFASGAPNGEPLLENEEERVTWNDFMTKSFSDFKKIKEQSKTVIAFYGKTHEAEFFACLTEAFFEKPKELAEEYPFLYMVLRRYYKLNPAEWFSNLTKVFY